jgi:hypothetical protein
MHIKVGKPLDAFVLNIRFRIGKVRVSTANVGKVFRAGVGFNKASGASIYVYNKFLDITWDGR